MLAIIIFAALFFPICWLYGWLAIHLVDRFFGTEAGEIDPLFYLLAGLVFLTTIGAALSLFIPLNWLAIGLILLGAAAILMIGARRKILVYPWRMRKGGHMPWPGWVLLGLVGISIIVCAVKLPSNPDTALYHAQTIHWIEAYRVVPGLGNLQSRFAYNSSWLVLNALFSFAFLGLGSLHLIPAMLYLLVCADFLRGVAGWLRGNFSLANSLRAMCLPLTFYIFGSEISSPGTDVPVVLMAWSLAAAWLEQQRTAAERLSTTDLVIAASAFFLVTIKLSAAPLALLAILPLLRKKIERRKLFQPFVLAGFILAPWCLRSLVLSGYLVYPIQFPDIFPFDWKIPASEVSQASRTILAWAHEPNGNVDRVLAAPVHSWVKNWFVNHSTNQQAVLAAAGLSPFAMVGVFAWKRARRLVVTAEEKRLAEIFLVALCGGVFWFFTAPDLRFGYGYVLLLVYLPVVYFLSGLAGLVKNWKVIFGCGLALLLVAYQAFFLVHSVDPGNLSTAIFLPADYRSLPSEPCDLENSTIFCAAEVSYTDCWYNPFPCIPRPVEGVYMRGDSWQDGFTTTPTP